MSIKRVAVIGGGLGGLALGQALKSIPSLQVAIYERDQSAFNRSQGYQIGIHGYGLESLQKLNLKQLNELLSLNPMNGVVIGNGIGTVDPWVRIPTSGASLVNRWKLRDLLLEDLTHHIQWNKRFHHYEESGEVVKVFFEDGSSIECDFLVGADGVNSKVRQQYRPDLRLNTSGYGSVAGFMDLSVASSATVKKLTPLVRMVEGNLVRLQLSDRQSLLCMKFIANNHQPHLLWSISYDKDHSLSKFGVPLISSMTTTELKQTLLPRISNVAAEISELVTQTPDERILLQKDYMSMLPIKKAHISPQNILSNKISLLGDAAHAMTTHAGLGANTAFKDALDLSEILRSPTIGINTSNWSSGHSKYELEMFRRGEKAIRASLGNTKRIHSDPSVTGRVLMKTIGFFIKGISFLKTGKFSLFR